MPPFFEHALRITWLVVVTYWLLAARSVKQAERQESLIKRLLVHWVPLIIAALLLVHGGRSFLPHTTLVYSLGLVLVVLGAVLAIYSRVVLGRNWSASVQLKQGHELVTNGPYRFVRHPIYSAFLLMFLGSAVMSGQWPGLFAIPIVFTVFWRKLKLEEAWLAGIFGETYRHYQVHTKALIPMVL